MNKEKGFRIYEILWGSNDIVTRKYTKDRETAEDFLDWLRWQGRRGHMEEVLWIPDKYE